jgi:hypothetical protein
LCEGYAREIEKLKEEIRDRADTESRLTGWVSELGAENERLKVALEKIVKNPCLNPEGNAEIASKALNEPKPSPVGDETLEGILTRLANNCYEEGAGKLNTTIDKELNAALWDIKSHLKRKIEALDDFYVKKADVLKALGI